MINACHYMRGGAEMVYFNTAGLLKSYGHEVAYFSSLDARNEQTEYEQYFVETGNIREMSLLRKIRMVPSYLYNSRAARQIERLILDFRPDIAHVHIFYGVLSVSILGMLRKHKVPLVHTVHDYRLLCPVNSLTDRNGNVCELCKDRHYYHCIIKRCSEGIISQSIMVTLEAYFWKYIMNPIKYIDHFIFVSDFSRGKHLEFNPDFEGRHTRIYNFTQFSEQGESSSKGDYFLYFGRLSAEKGIKTLVSAFSNDKGYRLKIAGNGPLREFVEEAAGASANIEYVGFRKGEDLANLIRESSFVILPSECYENNPLTIVEAYSFGKPVIGADTGGIKELINNGRNGFLFRSRDRKSLESAIKNSAILNDREYHEFSKSVRDFAKLKFDKEKHYLDLMEVYTRVRSITVPGYADKDTEQNP